MDGPIHIIILLLVVNLIKALKSYIYWVVSYLYIYNRKKLDTRSKKGYFVGYCKYSSSYQIYYHGENKVMKYKIVQFTEKFGKNMVYDVITNEDLVNFDSLDENGGFSKEKEIVLDNSDNIIGNLCNNNGNSISSESVSDSSGDNLCRSRNDERWRYQKPQHI